MVKIRKAKKEDLREIAEIFRKGFYSRPYSEKWSKKIALKKIKDYFGWANILVAEENEIIGFAVHQDYIMHDGMWRSIAEIVVSKSYRNKGVGKLLIKSVEKSKGKFGKTVLFTHKNSDAFQFYKKLDFKENGWVMVEKIFRK